jgi:hypothetical protein
VTVIPRIRFALPLPLPLPIAREPATDPMALMQAQLAKVIPQDAQRDKMFAAQSALLSQQQFQSTSATALAPASGVESFQNIIKDAKLTKLHGDALVAKISFASWITSHVNRTDQHQAMFSLEFPKFSKFGKSWSLRRGIPWMNPSYSLLSAGEAYISTCECS